MSSHCTVPHNTTPHYIESDQITPHHTTPHHTTSYVLLQYHIHHFPIHHFTLRNIILHHILNLINNDQFLIFLLFGISVIDFGFAKKVPYTTVKASTGEVKTHYKTFTLCGTPGKIYRTLFYYYLHNFFVSYVYVFRIIEYRQVILYRIVPGISSLLISLFSFLLSLLLFFPYFSLLFLFLFIFLYLFLFLLFSIHMQNFIVIMITINS